MAEPTKLADFALRESTLVIPGRGQFTFRELSMDENDKCREASTNKEGEFNGRTMIRLMAVQSSVSPKLTLADLGNLPQRIYAAVISFVNDLNDEATLNLDAEEEPGNA